MIWLCRFEQLLSSAVILTFLHLIHITTSVPLSCSSSRQSRNFTLCFGSSISHHHPSIQSSTKSWSRHRLQQAIPALQHLRISAVELLHCLLIRKKLSMSFKETFDVSQEREREKDSDHPTVSCTVASDLQIEAVHYNEAACPASTRSSLSSD